MPISTGFYYRFDLLALIVLNSGYSRSTSQGSDVHRDIDYRNPYGADPLSYNARSRNWTCNRMPSVPGPGDFNRNPYKLYYSNK